MKIFAVLAFTAVSAMQASICQHTTCTYVAAYEGNRHGTTTVYQKFPHDEKYFCEKDGPSGCVCKCHDSYKCTLNHHLLSGYKKELHHCAAKAPVPVPVPTPPPTRALRPCTCTVYKQSCDAKGHCGNVRAEVQIGNSMISEYRAVGKECADAQASALTETWNSYERMSGTLIPWQPLDPTGTALLRSQQAQQCQCPAGTAKLSDKALGDAIAAYNNDVQARFPGIMPEQTPGSGRRYLPNSAEPSWISTPALIKAWAGEDAKWMRGQCFAPCTCENGVADQRVLNCALYQHLHQCSFDGKIGATHGMNVQGSCLNNRCSSCNDGYELVDGGCYPKMVSKGKGVCTGATTLNSCSASGWGSHILSMQFNFADREKQCKNYCQKNEDCIGSYVARVKCPNGRAWCDTYRLRKIKMDKGYSSYDSPCVLYFKSMRNVPVFPNPTAFAGGPVIELKHSLGNANNRMKCSNQCGPGPLGFGQCFPDATKVTGVGGKYELGQALINLGYDDSQEGTCWAKE